MTICYIYGLVDPRSDQIRYIGKTTTSLKERYGAHFCSSALKPNTYKNRWLKKLLKLDLVPHICVLDTIFSDDVDAHGRREKYWISSYKDFGLLTNATDGGDGCWNPSAEARAKMSLAAKKRPPPMLGKHLSEESKLKISKANTGRKCTEKTKEKLREIAHTIVHPKGYTLSDETKKRIGAASKGNQYRKGISLSKEHADKLHDGWRGHKHTDAAKQKISAALKGLKRSPEYIEKMKTRTISDETRQRMRDARLAYVNKTRQDGKNG